MRMGRCCVELKFPSPVTMGGNGYKLSAQRLLGSFGWALMIGFVNGCLENHLPSKTNACCPKDPIFTAPNRLLLSWAGNWIKIRPPKKSQGVIGNSTDPVSRESLKWPNERVLLKRYHSRGSNGLKWCRFVSLVKCMEKKYATYSWWCNFLGVKTSLRME